VGCAYGRVPTGLRRAWLAAAGEWGE